MPSLTVADRVAWADVMLEQDRRADMLQPDFGRWMKYNRRDMPTARWDHRHMRYMQARFDEVTAGEVENLALGVAGRHGKSEHMKSYAVYLLERYPNNAEVLFATYSYEQAGFVGKEIRELAQSVGLPIVGSKPGRHSWDVEGGSGFRCVGVGTGTASLNPTHILIDDPIGKRADAESFAKREEVWYWLTTDILARVITPDDDQDIPSVPVIFSMPRWHVDDPFGRLLDQQAGTWTVVDMPGRALENDQLGREEGELLWPGMRGEKFHAKQRETGGAYGYESFIQCRPTMREGGMFKWAWWQTIDAVPAVGRMIRYWDLAGTEPRGRNHDPDYSAGVLECRMPDKRTAIVDVERSRKSIAARDAWLEAIAREDLENYGYQRVSWWIETEAGIAGKERTAELVKRLQGLGMSVKTEHPTGKKELRAEPLAGAAEAGNIVLCPGEWRDPFRQEMSEVFHGRHDDQADAAAGAFQKLAARKATIVRSFRI